MNIGSDGHPFKRMVFHFYLDENFRNNAANIAHLCCLNRYSSIFDESIIVICVDDVDNKELIDTCKQEFIRVLHSPIVSFKVAKNTCFFEANTFKKEIVDKLHTTDGIVFFAHNKGVSNVLKQSCSVDSVINWICAMYYLNLKTIDEVVENLCEQFNGVFYGSFLMTDNTISNKNHIWYAGTFFWLNPRRVSEYIRQNDMVDYQYCDRTFAELYPGENFNWGNGLVLCSHRAKMLYNTNLYENSDGAINFLLDNNEKDDFYKLVGEVEDKISYFKYSVLTYNFNHYEILREVKHKDKNVEYVYVTDDKNLISSTWNIIYDESLEGLSTFEKVLYVRTHPFKYCSSSICVRIDASIEVNGSMDKIIEDFNASNYEMAVMVHPERENIIDEYYVWEETRGLDETERKNMILYSQSLTNGKYDIFKYKGLYETGFMIIRRNKWTEEMLLRNFSEVLTFKKENIEIRVDQALFSFLLNQYYYYLHVMPLSHNIIQNDNILSWMTHGSENLTCRINVINNNEGYLFNKKVVLYN